MRSGPVILTFLVGTALIALFFIPHHKAQAINAELLVWATVIYGLRADPGARSRFGTRTRGRSA